MSYRPQCESEEKEYQDCSVVARRFGPLLQAVIAEVSMRIAFIAGYCLITSVAFAHDDYPADCCGDHDCHPVPCDEITVRSDGYFWKGLIFLWSSQRTSPDGRCHVCHLMKGTTPVLPICIMPGGIS